MVKEGHPHTKTESWLGIKLATDIISKLIIRCLITCQTLIIYICNIISSNYSNSLLSNDSVLTASYLYVHLVN
jgi:hypothetical protein